MGSFGSLSVAVYEFVSSNVCPQISLVTASWDRRTKLYVVYGATNVT